MVFLKAKRFLCVSFRIMVLVGVCGAFAATKISVSDTIEYLGVVPQPSLASVKSVYVLPISATQDHDGKWVPLVLRGGRTGAEAAQLTGRITFGPEQVVPTKGFWPLTEVKTINEMAAESLASFAQKTVYLFGGEASLSKRDMYYAVGPETTDPTVLFLFIEVPYVPAEIINNYFNWLNDIYTKMPILRYTPQKLAAGFTQYAWFSMADFAASLNGSAHEQMAEFAQRLHKEGEKLWVERVEKSISFARSTDTINQRIMTTLLKEPMGRLMYRPVDATPTIITEVTKGSRVPLAAEFEQSLRKQHPQLFAQLMPLLWKKMRTEHEVEQMRQEEQRKIAQEEVARQLATQKRTAAAQKPAKQVQVKKRKIRTRPKKKLKKKKKIAKKRKKGRGKVGPKRLKK